MNDQSSNYALTRLYHPSGALVSIPLPMENELSSYQASSIFDGVDKLISAGFMVNAPGLEQGEMIQEVVSVSRREHTDNTPIVAFYVAHPKMVNKLLHAYLNKPEDIAAFEAVTGLKLNSIPLYEGETYIKKDSPKASRYIVQLPKPIKIVYELTEKWKRWDAEGRQGNEPHKHQLLRYDGYTPPVKAAQPPQSDGKVIADPQTGELLGQENVELEPVDPDDVQYDKMKADFINLLSQRTNLRPDVIAPILSKLPGKTMSLRSAIPLIKSNLGSQE